MSKGKVKLKVEINDLGQARLIWPKHPEVEIKGYSFKSEGYEEARNEWNELCLFLFRYIMFGNKHKMEGCKDFEQPK